MIFNRPWVEMNNMKNVVSLWKLSTYKPCAELSSLVRLTMDQLKMQTILFLLTQLKISTTRSPAVSNDWNKITLVETVLISTSSEMQHHEMLRWWSLLRLWRVWKDSKGKECDPLCLPPPRAAALIRGCDDSSRLCHIFCICKALHWSVKEPWRLISSCRVSELFLEP